MILFVCIIRKIRGRDIKHSHSHYDVTLDDELIQNVSVSLSAIATIYVKFVILFRGESEGFSEMFLKTHQENRSIFSKKNFSITKLRRKA